MWQSWNGLGRRHGSMQRIGVLQVTEHGVWSYNDLRVDAAIYAALIGGGVRDRISGDRFMAP